MTRCHRSSCTSLLLLALLSVAPQLPASAATLPASDSPSSSSASGISGPHDIQVQQLAQAAAAMVGQGAIRTHRRGGGDDESGVRGVLAASERSSPPSPDVSAAWALASLLMDSIDHPRKEVEVEEEEEEEEERGPERERAADSDGDDKGISQEGVGREQLGYTQERMKEEEEESMETLREQVNMAARELADYKGPSDERGQQWGEVERDQNSTVTQKGSQLREGVVAEKVKEEEELREEEERSFERQVDNMANDLSKTSTNRDAGKLQRETRGYFQNIDLGLQDNEILPPLKGYKAYNQQLAQATKKLKWQEDKTKEPPAAVAAAAPGYERNFMDDFEQVADEDEDAARENEEARARAEQEELLRQQAEAEAARDEEQRLADIASDMLLEYMDRKQQTSFTKQRQKASILGNMAEDKRSNEVESDDDDGDMDLQTIDRLIEISSKLHLPADDVVEIISDVEEKKRRKDNPAVSVPRFRPLVAPSRPQTPLYKYSPPPAPPKISKPSKPFKSVNPYKKWYKEKGKSKVFKQDYWFKPAKQFMAYPSYPYYQKPYRAYYPVYFPPPKPRLYSKPAFAYDYNFEDSLDYGIKPPKRRNMNKLKGKGQSWKVMPMGPPSPYISNYIMPHPRTYYSLPMPKPQPPANRRPASSYYYPQDYDNVDLGEQQENDEELENFIEKIYFHRRIF
ncbi:neurosecretory protein VGF [Alosa sapidissima]|uniref:neurosecretory protein VGF n=1 Tax=Alosa sapidissima TaxID=34773 RepID=UPI001C081E9B|nr:neurosecretory protein VGF [Alosa sapidissima]XP_041949754.1 neurosecretory protein VGF [Alosa sapidissima]